MKRYSYSEYGCTVKSDIPWAPPFVISKTMTTKEVNSGDTS